MMEVPDLFTQGREKKIKTQAYKSLPFVFPPELCGINASFLLKMVKENKIK
jgi:hypothetical protein